MTLLEHHRDSGGRRIDAACVAPAPVVVRGKFFWSGDEKFIMRGVTYGPFAPEPDGSEYGRREQVAGDFDAMVEQGINTVRVYTVPPRWLLDTAAERGLRVMVGLPWQQHVAFLDDRAQARQIMQVIHDGVAQCAGHPAVFAYAIGNEIPASIVRWLGRHRVQKFLAKLARIARRADPEALITYVNFPTTEYLRLDFCDFVCFNVYLESIDRFDAYLSRLQNLSDDRPLVLAELGLDSRRNGVDEQARQLSEQINCVWRGGGAGVFVFAWTDQWHRGGLDIADWDFGLTSRDREPKPALAAVAEAYARAPFGDDLDWPRVSVVVCSYNGSRTIGQTCDHLVRLDYPDYEVIIVNDGSTDATGKIVAEYPFRVITLENGGLSRARNVGMNEATGEIVAYIDDDAYPDPHWLRYLAWRFMTSDHAGVGGPNLPPAGAGMTADCIANAPGGPTHVLLDDVTAEHIPGCNMAFRRDRLMAIGGFDQRFRIAGDDVDLCWRLMEKGWTIGFHAGAFVWHHRRNRVKIYLKQQKNYGRAEAMLEQKWPTKYNAAGHVPWMGRIYGRGLVRSLLGLQHRVYQGIWGSAPFQRIYEGQSSLLASLTMMPEWYLITVALALLTALGFSWAPLFIFAPLWAIAMLIPVVQAGLSAARAKYSDPCPTRLMAVRRRLFTAWLHLIQPPARLYGRLREGLTPWRRRHRVWNRPHRQVVTLWRQLWTEPNTLLQNVEDQMRRRGAIAVYGGPYDDWDLCIRGGLLGTLRLRMAVEEHGQGRQLFRFILMPVWFRVGGWIAIVLASIALIAALNGAFAAYVVLALTAIILEMGILHDCGVAQCIAQNAIKSLGSESDTVILEKNS